MNLMIMLGQAYLGVPSVAPNASPVAIRVASVKNLILLVSIYDWADRQNNQHLYN